ncbi:hypothetical protein KQ878_02940 [Mycoplasma zalophidermidis]|uniref:Extracellular matrix-binding protein ebh GA module domain-containing protein n=2 Tax=Mycoplasma zalophidermidis TaxID=398174 RepID=A0ABS6DS30_9MOLU|nr:hypothetical protein [Mycoplasma zalophidermidis]MBU4693823.1 hypothetical protein [Mycoplasma zalophidermidis]
MHKKTKKQKVLSATIAAITPLTTLLTLYSIVDQTNFNNVQPIIEFQLDKPFSQLSSKDINDLKNYKITSKNNSQINFLGVSKNNDSNSLVIKYQITVGTKKSRVFTKILPILNNSTQKNIDTTASKAAFEELKKQISDYISTLDKNKDKATIDDLNSLVSESQKNVDKPNANNAEIILETNKLKTEFDKEKYKKKIKLELEKISNIETQNDHARSFKEQTISKLTQLINYDRAGVIDLAIGFAQAKDSQTQIDILNSMTTKYDTTASKAAFEELKKQISDYISTLDQTKDKTTIDDLNSLVSESQKNVDKPNANNAEITLQTYELNQKFINAKSRKNLKDEINKLANVQTKNDQAKLLKEQTLKKLNEIINNKDATNVELAINLAKAKDSQDKIDSLNTTIEKNDTTASKAAFEELKKQINNYISTLDQTKDKATIDDLNSLVSESQKNVDKPNANNAEITLQTYELNQKFINAKSRVNLKGDIDKLANVQTKNNQAKDFKEKTIEKLNQIVNNDQSTNIDLILGSAQAKDSQSQINSLNSLEPMGDTTASKAAFEAVKNQIKNYLSSLDQTRDKDLITALNNLVDQSQKNVDKTDAQSREIILLANKLNTELELTKSKKQIRDLQEQLDSAIKPPTVYIPGDKSIESILKDYQAKIKEFKDSFELKTKELSDKFQTEIINDADNKDDFPKSYKEIHNLNNPTKSFNDEFIKLLSTEGKWVENQLTLSDDQREHNSIIVDKINKLHQLNYLWLVRTNFEEKIETSRETIRHFIKTLSTSKYSTIVSELTNILKLKPSNNASNDYIFSEQSSVSDLNKINQNLRTLLSSIPGKIAKNDFKEEIKADKKTIIPAILNFYRESDNIDEAKNPWIVKVKNKQTSLLETKAQELQDSLQGINDADYINIHNKINEYTLLKNDYLDAYKKLTKVITTKFVNNELNKRLGKGNDIESLMKVLFEQEKYDKSNALFINSAQSGVKNFLSTQKNIINEIIKGMDLLPISTGVNVLAIGEQARSAYESIVRSELTKLETPFTGISNKINEFLTKIKDNKLKYQKSFYSDADWNLELFNKFLLAVDKDSGENVVKVKSIYDEYAKCIKNIESSNLSVGEKITELTKLLSHENNYFRGITQAMKSYYDNRMKSEQIKDLLTKKLIDSQIIYAFGVEDDGSYSSKHSLGGYAQFSYESSLASKTNTHKWSDDSKYLDDLGLLSLQGSSEGLGLSATKYMKDISRLINNNTSEKVGTNIKSFAYALFLLVDDPNGSKYIQNDKNLILESNIWDWYGSNNDYWVYSLFGDDATYWYHVGVYEILTYLLLGLIDAYEVKYTQINKVKPDGEYDSKVVLDSNKSNIFKYAKFILDVYGVNSFKSWVKVNGENSFKNFKEQTQEFDHKTFDRNEPYNSVLQVSIGTDLSGKNINGVDYVNNGQTSVVSTGQQVDAKAWISQNVKPNLFKTYELLYKEFIKLSSVNGSEYIKPLINKKFMSLIDSSVENKKKIKRDVIKDYSVLDTNNLKDFALLKGKYTK